MTAPLGFVDLHLHTIHSDGMHTPEEVVAFAHSARLVAIAITDHDTLDGIDAAASAAGLAGMEFIPGIELSASDGPSDVHILGYYLDPSTPGLGEELSRLRDRRFLRAQRTVELLNQLGATVSFERVQAIAGGAAIGRPHIATALIEAGHVATHDQAFESFIGYHAPAFVPKHALDPAAAMDLIRRAGGVAVLAHPGSLRRDDLIPSLVAQGLGGIEVWHPKHDGTRVRHYQEIASKHGLSITGGSDFHGGGRGASTVGDQPVPAGVLDSLRARTHPPRA
jgi:predicted metal-dependent phosphoesterase TrpH